MTPLMDRADVATYVQPSSHAVHFGSMPMTSYSGSEWIALEGGRRHEFRGALPVLMVKADSV